MRNIDNVLPNMESLLAIRNFFFGEFLMVALPVYFVSLIVAGSLHEGGGRWRTGEWRPWVPPWVRILLVVGMFLPFIPFIVLILLLVIPLWFIVDLPSYVRRGLRAVKIR